MKNLIKNLIVTLGILSLFLQPIYAEEKVESKSLKLEKTEGTVSVTNSRDKKLTLRDGAKLYNNYTVTTEEGYAWISLDDSKLIKLDWYTSVTIKKNKKKYEILVNVGNLFFNVSKPLEEDETLNIRTSTMSTGIRGTLGKVSVSSGDILNDDDFGSALVEIYEGKVVTTYRIEDASILQEDVGIGNRLDLTKNVNKDDYNYFAEKQNTEVSVAEALKESGFIAVEVKENEDLKERVMSGETLLSKEEVEEIIVNAESQLMKDQATKKEEIEQNKNQNEELLKALNEKNKEVTSFVDFTTVEEVKPSTSPTSTEKPIEAPTADVKSTKEPSVSSSMVTPAPSLKSTTIPTTIKPTSTPTPTPVVTSEPAKVVEPVVIPVPAPTVEPVIYYTVTYQFDGRVFAKQVIRKGLYASEPYFQPSLSGQWEKDNVSFDFSQTRIFGDTVITWNKTY